MTCSRFQLSQTQRRLCLIGGLLVVPLPIYAVGYVYRHEIAYRVLYSLHHGLQKLPKSNKSDGKLLTRTEKCLLVSCGTSLLLSTGTATMMFADINKMRWLWNQPDITCCRMARMGAYCSFLYPCMFALNLYILKYVITDAKRVYYARVCKVKE